MMGLTARQAELLEFLKARIAGGQTPSIDEMRDAINVKSKNGVVSLLKGLEERGFIRRIPHKARAIEIVDAPKQSPLSILPRDTRNFVIEFAKAEGTSPEVLVAEWVRDRCDDERKAAGNFGELRSA